MTRHSSRKSAGVAKKPASQRSVTKTAKPRKAVAKVSARTPAPPAAKSVDAAKGRPHTVYHKDGSMYAMGRMLDGKMHGYWEFYRKDGTIMRSGSFDREQQIGTWTTYDASGKPVKVTEMKAGAKPRSGAKVAKPRKAAARSSDRKPVGKAPRSGAKPRLLSGGNPQIAKADGDGAVQAYIEAMPGWKKGVGQRLDAIIVRAVPDVRKAVRWNSPFYGVEGRGWFLGVHCITKYVKVAFFRSAALRPLPPVASRKKDVRYFHIHETDEIDEEQLASWVRTAAELPGEDCF